MKKLFVTLLFLLGTFKSLASVPVLQISDSINVSTAEYIRRALLIAEKEKLPAILIELDTPGGYLEATRDIVQALLNSKDTKIIVWVTPKGGRAASAGSMITMAAHFAAMSEGTSIGAATPIEGVSGKDIAKDLSAKVKNDTLSFVEGIAKVRGRNIEWARDSVKSAASLSATDAKAQNVIDGVYNSRGELWAAVLKKFPDLPASTTFEIFPPTPKESFLNLVSNPNISYGLLTLGALGIYVEMTHPGLIVPGVVGTLSLVLGAITMKIVPIRPGAIALLIASIVLIIIEILTPLPTFGIAGLAGVVAMFLSGLFLLDSSQTNLTLTPSLWLPTFAVALGFMGLIGWSAIRSFQSRYKQGFDGMHGKEATVASCKVLQDGSAQATVQLGGELWTARWHKDFALEKFSIGMKVVVVDQKGFVFYVRPQKH